jgi:hypothetical protein
MGVSAMGRRVQESSRSVARGSRHGRRAPLTASSPCALIMLGDDEDVFDSVTWESAKPAPPFAADDDDSGGAGAGPGFRQSADDDAGRDPHEPRWEGFLTTAVRDPTKELAETKDAYVSYLVAAEVRATRASVCCAAGAERACRRICRYTPTRRRPCVGGTRTLCFCARTSSRTFPHVSFRPCRVSNAWVSARSGSAV